MLPNDMQKKKSDSEPENDQYTILYIYVAICLKFQTNCNSYDRRTMCLEFSFN